ncbi:DUF1289 domain-containing protein [Azospirillum agricola]|uniref:DUF1289 domain-containing protein n=1 Tax=Azospirillum agricola TaxID=1720247 RepID=UPI000A0EF2F2|nr:DUF1289 domain-containing protein [Azospirillum agricola]SMH55446.1 hypothetical protein SAMN02982994_3810 [Azospirillum lipoferum]
MAVDENHVPSPCVRLCTLDGADVCLGCFRSIGEIKAWGGLDADGRRAVLAGAERRRAQAAPSPWRMAVVRPRG